MTNGTVTIVAILLFGNTCLLNAQGFRVQLTAYNERQPASFFKERGIEHYSEVADRDGIFWYSAGHYTTREEAETVQTAVIGKGFPNAIIIDELEQQVLSGIDCPYIRDGVVFTKAPVYDPSTHILYFDFGSSSLTPEATSELDEVSLKMKKSPGLTLKIHGFTDGVGDAKDNMQLAAVRSRAARDYLIFKGVRADRMFMEVFGEAEPAAPNAEDDGSNAGKGRDLPENRKWNRRVTLTLAPPGEAPHSPK